MSDDTPAEMPSYYDAGKTCKEEDDPNCMITNHATARKTPKHLTDRRTITDHLVRVRMNL